MYKNQKISLVMPAYNEKEAVKTVIMGYRSLGIIDEVIVIDNNSTDGTGKLAEESGARIIRETKQGYGYACIRGLKEAKGDLIILSECDGTFLASDVYKLLEYIDDYNMVIGSRVHKKFYHSDANMNWIIKWGNFVLAKTMEMFYPGNFKLNDVGCTFRIIEKTALDKFVNRLCIGGGDFTPELTFEALKSKVKIIQIPISYQPRLGKSKLSPDLIHSLKLGIKHFFHIISRRYES